MSLTEKHGLFLTEDAGITLQAWRNKINGEDVSIQWNGTTTGIPSVTNGVYTYYKVSGETPEVALVAGRIVTCSVDGLSADYEISEADIASETGCYYDQTNHSFIVCTQENITLNGEAKAVEIGIYFVKTETLVCTQMTDRSNMSKIDDALASLDEKIDRHEENFGHITDDERKVWNEKSDEGHIHAALTFGSKTYDGTDACDITAADLGLSGAMKYLGVTTTDISDGSATNTVSIGGNSIAVTNGNVVIYSSKEFVWNGSAWEEFGNEGNYKVLQGAVTSPTASGSAIAFIDTISQDEQGKITATKKNVNFSDFVTKNDLNLAIGAVIGGSY